MSHMMYLGEKFSGNQIKDVLYLNVWINIHLAHLREKSNVPTITQSNSKNVCDECGIHE